MEFQNFTLNQLVSSKIVSSKFSEIVNKSYNSEINTFNDIINNELINGKLSLSESNYLKVYSSIYNSSYTYWSNTSTQKAQSCKWCIYAGDAVGGVLGLWGSPAWSIIQGALVSAAIDS